LEESTAKEISKQRGGKCALIARNNKRRRCAGTVCKMTKVANVGSGSWETPRRKKEETSSTGKPLLRPTSEGIVTQVPAKTYFRGDTKPSVKV